MAEIQIITSLKLGKTSSSETSIWFSMFTVCHTLADFKFFTSLWFELTDPTVAYTGSFLFKVPDFLDEIFDGFTCS